MSAEPVRLAATDPLVRYVGRFDRSEAAGPRAAWTASAVALTFTGPSLQVELADEGKNFWQIVIDGAPTGVLALQPGAHLYPVAEGLSAGPHTVELVKRTEYHLGTTQVRGFVLAAGSTVEPTPARPRRIEVIGDSISCGYGNEAPRKEEHFSPATENGWLAYGAVAARAVDADYLCVAWSGKKLWPDNSILDHYENVIPDPAAPKWEFAAWTPDAVVINLGTNDFGRANPDREGWVAAYVALLQRLRQQYPGAPIYCTVGTMMGDWPESRRPRTTILGYLDAVIARAAALPGAPVRLIDFGVQDEATNGIGADWHPSVKTDAAMGAQLAARLKADLHW